MINASFLAQVRAAIRAIPAFHKLMALASAFILGFSFIGCHLKSIQVPGVAGTVIAFLVVTAAIIPLPLYWHEKGKIELRDAALTLPWGLLFALILPYPVAVFARLGMNRGMQDSYFAQLDQMLGVSIPRMVVWGSHHWLGSVANRSYVLLVPFIPISLFLPGLTGKVKHAQEYVTANLIAFALGLPLFALFPAIGPWIGFHLSPSSPQTACQVGLLLLRRPGVYVFHADGVVCFPSFHVLWAILCGYALWGFRLFRVPVATLSGLIILSTMTTGWHYFVDVLAGCLLAIIAIAAARAISPR